QTRRCYPHRTAGVLLVTPACILSTLSYSRLQSPHNYCHFVLQPYLLRCVHFSQVTRCPPSLLSMRLAPHVGRQCDEHRPYGFAWRLCRRLHPWSDRRQTYLSWANAAPWRLGLLPPEHQG